MELNNYDQNFLDITLVALSFYDVCLAVDLIKICAFNDNDYINNNHLLSNRK